MMALDPKAIVLQFNDCINTRDIDGLAFLMSEDHIFIDTQENQIYGKKNSLSAWKNFFELFPDYKNTFRTIIITDNLVKIRGYSTCSDNRLNGLSIWTARIKGEKIAEWRVYDDTADNISQLNL